MAVSILRSLLAPWWAAQLLTGARSFRDNPLIGSRRLNRHGLHAGRVRLAAKLAGKGATAAVSGPDMARARNKAIRRSDISMSHPPAMRFATRPRR